MQTLTSRPLLDRGGQSKPNTLPALFISHVAPNLAIEKSSTINALARIGQNLPKPRAIIIMSAHWQSPKLEINSNPKPAIWHNFTGFSQELYDIRYPAKGLPELAESLSIQLMELGEGYRLIHNSLNAVRAFDHGVWIPLLHMYPNADIPIIQISLPYRFDSYACYQLGAVFANLRAEQILLIGSGSITHNLCNLQWQADSEDQTAKDFKFWLLNKLKNDIPSALDWQTFNAHRQVHPSDEHLLPLFFALGAGNRVSVVHESMAHYSLGMDIYRFD